MSFTKILNMLYIKKHAKRALLTATVIFSASGFAMVSQSYAETLRIEVNKASILKLTETPSTIIIGNPALADVTPQDNNVLVLVGKASGRTNIIILDDQGDILHNYDIAVQEEQSGNLTLYKAGAQWSFSCAPYCERVINPNDAEDAFGINLNQVSAKSSQMTQAANDAAASIDSEVGGSSGYGLGGGVAINNTAGAGAGEIDPAQFQTFTILPPQQ